MVSSSSSKRSFSPLSYLYSVVVELSISVILPKSHGILSLKVNWAASDWHQYDKPPRDNFQLFLLGKVGFFSVVITYPFLFSFLLWSISHCAQWEWFFHLLLQQPLLWVNIGLTLYPLLFLKSTELAWLYEEEITDWWWEAVFEVAVFPPKQVITTEWCMILSFLELWAAVCVCVCVCSCIPSVALLTWVVLQLLQVLQFPVLQVSIFVLLSGSALSPFAHSPTTKHWRLKC